MQLLSVTKSGSCKVQDDKFEPIEGHASITVQLQADDLDKNGNIYSKVRRQMDNLLVSFIEDSIDAAKVAKDATKAKK